MQRELYGSIRHAEDDHWWYVGRRAIVFEWVDRFASTSRQLQVLDLGCGTGFNLTRLASGGWHPVGADLSEDALRFCRERGARRLVQTDAARPPFRDSAFDLILALDVIEHIEDDGAALAAMWRALKPGGRVIVFTPAFQFLWSVQDRVSHHFRRYTSKQLRVKLEDAGFTIEKLSYANTVLFPLVWLGRTVIKWSGRSESIADENGLHPRWSNALLAWLFSAERLWLRYGNLPFGVSLLAVVRKAPDK